MQLGFVSAILPDLSFDEVISTASDIGYDCVEVMCWPLGKAERRYAGVTHIDAAALDDAAIANIQSTLKENRVEISGLGYYPNPLSPDLAESATAVDQIRRVIDACVLLGVRQMNTFIGCDWTKSVDDNWPRFLETWKPLVEFAAERDVRIGIENCPMFFSNDEWPSGKNLAYSPRTWRRMFADLDSNWVGLNYDPSHPVWLHMDYLKPMVEFADRLFHVHAKDVRVDQDRLDDVGILANPADFHTPKLPGMGDVQWGRFFSILGDSGYSGPVCVEVEDRAYEGSLERRVAALRQSHTFLRNFIPRSN
jgi:sugar phosphate isomerase/epimerase